MGEGVCGLNTRKRKGKRRYIKRKINFEEQNTTKYQKNKSKKGPSVHCYNYTITIGEVKKPGDHHGPHLSNTCASGSSTLNINT
jgi:hypothetical protein